MGYGRFGEDRHRPAGEWVQATNLLRVAGVHHRKAAVAAFGSAVARAERKRQHYGLEIERQRNNSNDPNAIAVYGVARVAGLFGAKTKRWHIGFVPQEVAADISPNLIDQGIPVSVELYNLFNGIDDYWEVKFFLLGPPGHSAPSRARAARLS
jgi:hypothetical protein